MLSAGVALPRGASALLLPDASDWPRFGIASYVASRGFLREESLQVAPPIFPLLCPPGRLCLLCCFFCPDFALPGVYV